VSGTYRFISGGKRGSYSVWRGETWLGHVTKIVHRHAARGVTTTVVSGWTPSTAKGIDLSSAPNRKAAADALWRIFQSGGAA
jgi:hypothetical protein